MFLNTTKPCDHNNELCYKSINTNLLLSQVPSHFIQSTNAIFMIAYISDY